MPSDQYQSASCRSSSFNLRPEPTLIVITRYNRAIATDYFAGSVRSSTEKVLSYPPLSVELKQAFSTAKIKNHSVEIREYNSIAEIEACQMLFIPAFKSRSFEDALTKIGTKSTLIISNKLGLAQKGAGVNFILVDGKPKYEINCKTIEKRGMKISSAVKGMGILIE